jgi:hypothetical protein
MNNEQCRRNKKRVGDLRMRFFLGVLQSPDCAPRVLLCTDKKNSGHGA